MTDHIFQMEAAALGHRACNRNVEHAGRSRGHTAMARGVRKGAPRAASYLPSRWIPSLDGS